MVTKNYVVKEVGSKRKADGLVLVVSVVPPPLVVGGISLVSVEQPITFEVPTTAASLLADMEEYSDGNVVPVTFGAPVAAPAA